MVSHFYSISATIILSKIFVLSYHFYELGKFLVENDTLVPILSQ